MHREERPLDTQDLVKFKKEVFPDDWIILDIGSGDKPDPRATILADLRLGKQGRNRLERYLKETVTDRPFVRCSIENLPFQDKSVDFIISTQIFEHLKYPEKAAEEVCRVGQAGFLQSPGWLMETIIPRIYHLWMIQKSFGKLIFETKEHYRDRTGNSQHICYVTGKDDWNFWFRQQLDKNLTFAGLFHRNHNVFYSTVRWQDSFEIEVIR